MKSSTKAECYLVLVSAIFGMTFPLLHTALKLITPSQFVFYRFLLSTLFLFPFIQKEFIKTDVFILFGASVFALLNCAAYLFQTIGLETTNASRGAFITGLSVLFVPFFSPFFNLSKPRTIDFLRGAFCLFGLYFLTGSDLDLITSGDFFLLLSAIFFSLIIILVQCLTKRIKDYLLLTFYQIFFTVIIISPFIKVEHSYSNWTGEIWTAILFCSFFATVLSLFIQIRVQQYTTATKSAVIFTLEPVFAYIFNWILNGENLLSWQIFGGVLILVSIVLPDLTSYARLFGFIKRFMSYTFNFFITLFYFFRFFKKI